MLHPAPTAPTRGTLVHRHLGLGLLAAGGLGDQTQKSSAGKYEDTTCLRSEDVQLSLLRPSLSCTVAWKIILSVRSRRRRMTGLTLHTNPRQPVRWSGLPLRGPGLALSLLAVVLVGGTMGYVVIENWSVWDALYMTVTTVATVGYREVHPLSWRGQAFTLVLVIGGVGTALYAFMTIAGVIVEGGWDQFLQQRRLTRMLDNLTNHFILCGYGRIGSIIADEFHRQSTPFVIIDADAGRVQTAQARGYAAIQADASHDDTLLGAGIQRARGLVAAVGTDAENVYTILTARCCDRNCSWSGGRSPKTRSTNCVELGQIASFRLTRLAPRKWHKPRFDRQWWTLSSLRPVRTISSCRLNR